MRSTDSMDLLFSYGSLLSQHSRQHHSGITSTVIPARLNGWQRSWCARYEDEGATYAGAIESSSAQITGLLIPTEITDEIRHRERKYEFVEVPRDQLTINADSNPELLVDNRLWICRVVEKCQPESTTPLPQTYIDTCLKGCLEIGNQMLAQEFIDETIGWDGIWINDREYPVYPRAAQVSKTDIEVIDRLLDTSGILQYRRNTIVE